jgi:hypothetical protein
MFESLLERIATALDAAGIPYMVIGGQAVLVHGEPRLTRDVDITLGVDIDQLPAVLRVVTVLGLVPLVDPEAFTRATMVLPCQDARTQIRVDLIFSFSPYERQAIGRAGSIRMGSADVQFASVEDLIVHKILAGRPRDLDDVRAVLNKNPAADRGFVRDKLAEFSATLGEPLVERFDAVAGGASS